MSVCPGSSTGSKITEAEVADHTGKASGSQLLLTVSNWAVFETVWDIRARNPGRLAAVRVGAPGRVRTPGCNVRLHFQKRSMAKNV